MNTALCLAGIVVGFMVGILPALIFAMKNGVTVSDIVREAANDMRRIMPRSGNNTADEHIDLADIQAHRQTARHGIEPHRSFSQRWLRKRELD